MMNGAECTIKLLEDQGITTITGIPGGSNLPLYDALEKSRINHILARHEQGAGFIAQGMARANGMPAVCFATSGPGATNVLTALADAYLDGIPIIIITGQVPTSLLGKDSFQEVDIIAMAKPVTKKCYFITETSMLCTIIPEAFRIAREGKPGPVLIDIPKNIQLAPCEENSRTGCTEEIEKSYPEISMLIDKAIALISEAERPLLYIGGGVAGSKCAADSIIAIAEKSAIPMVSTLMGLGAISSSHPLFLGMSGMHGSAAANLVFDRSDLIIGIGVRFGDRATGKVSEFGRSAKIIQINRDSSESGKIKDADVFLHGDTEKITADLGKRLQKNCRGPWIDEIEAIRNLNPAYRPADNGRVYPCNLISAIGAATDSHALITTDVGQHQMWVAQYFPFSGDQMFLTSGGLGTMGFGLPAAIGAALARPDRQVLCFSGDGSLLMNIQELATLAELNLEVKIILLNNSQLGLVRQQQEMLYGGRYIASKFMSSPEFAEIASGFGIEASRYNDSDITKELMTSLLTRRGPQLVEIAIDQELNVLPMVVPGAANYEMVME